jgi:hypothetical protein
MEQARWNQAQSDTLFYAGEQSYVNRHFNFSPGISYQNFYFNVLQQPINLVTGYQRQHRKSISYLPTEGSDPHTCDQYTRLIMNSSHKEAINEQFSKACELAAISGMVLMQPYLDYIGDDPAQGSLKVKIWEYNAFLVDPYWRNPDMSDAQYVWCQEYISKREAEERFPDKIGIIAPMVGSPQRHSSFYFLPENYNLARNDLMVLSYVWYKWKRKKKRLYSKSRNQFFDFVDREQEQLEEMLYRIPDLELVTVECPTWKLAVVLNDQLMFQGNNPLGGDKCPFIPVYWNYEPHINYYDLRVRSLVRCLRSPQYLLNRRIILNHDISESSINSGWKRKIGAVANEDNLKKSGQGWDVLINEGYNMEDCEKIIPNAVPASDMQLADQLMSLIFSVSGINMENWSAQEDANASSLTVMMKQAANLMVLQKYYDQWDYSLKQLGERLLEIMLHNWNAAKVGLLLGEEPSPFFFSQIFSKYQVVVQEGLDTATQQQTKFKQVLELNQLIGGIIPPSYIASIAPIQGKEELMQVLQQQEQQQAAVQQHATTVQHALEEAKLKELYSKATMNIANARERHGRNESNIGLFEERLSMIGRNRAAAVKDKVESLNKLIEAIQKYGEVETLLKSSEIQSLDRGQMLEEDREKMDSKRTAEGNRFVAEMLSGMNRQQQPQGMEQPQGEMQPQEMGQ